MGRTKIGLSKFLGSTFETEVLSEFAAGAPLAHLGRCVYSDEAKRAVRVMRRLGVKRSRAKVREYLTKNDLNWWRSMYYTNGRIYHEDYQIKHWAKRK